MGDVLQLAESVAPFPMMNAWNHTYLSMDSFGSADKVLGYFFTPLYKRYILPIR